MKLLFQLFGSLKFIALFSIGVHVAIVLTLKHYESPQTWENGMIAQHVINGEGFSGGFSKGTGELTSWQAPGYPYLLVTFWNIFDQSATAFLLISLLQCLAVASMIFPIYWLTERWFGKPAAVLAAWITVLMPLYAWYPTRIHHTALVMAVHPWLLWGWVTLRSGQWKQGLGTGILTGMAGLFQPVLLVPYGIYSGYRFVRAVLRKETKLMQLILISGFITLACLLPWTIRNYKVQGKLMLVKNSFGKEFWMGNNPHATGTGYAKGGADEITNVYPPKAMQFQGQVSEMELMTLLKQEAWEYVKLDPAGFIQRSLTKACWFWTMTPAQYLRSTGDGEALTFRWIHAGYWGIFILFVVYALLAMMRTKHRQLGEVLGLISLFVFIYSMVYGLTHVGQARFRGEIEFLFIPLVSYGCIRMIIKLCPQFIKL